jgi:hypothetical protein
MVEVTDPPAARGEELNASTRRFEIEGRSLGFPALFQDASSAVGLFAVPSKAANALIRESGFEVAEIWPGRAIFSLACVHYRESDCGAYNEIAMGFFVKKQAQAPGIPYLGTWLDILRDRAATYVWKLPVTTRLANDAGILMWGLPKTIEEIDFELGGERRGQGTAASQRIDGLLRLRGGPARDPARPRRPGCGGTARRRSSQPRWPSPGRGASQPGPAAPAAHRRLDGPRQPRRGGAGKALGRPGGSAEFV